MLSLTTSFSTLRTVSTMFDLNVSHQTAMCMVIAPSMATVRGSDDAVCVHVGSWQHECVYLCAALCVSECGNCCMSEHLECECVCVCCLLHVAKQQSTQGGSALTWSCGIWIWSSGRELSTCCGNSHIQLGLVQVRTTIGPVHLHTHATHSYTHAMCHVPCASSNGA
jgi:hypothetical protein